MKIVIAPDSFKGSLSASEICEIVEKASQQVMPECEVVKVPVADGGEGTVESIIATLGGEMKMCQVCGPMGKQVEAQYGIFNHNQAVIEMAAASGLPLVSEDDKNIFKANTRGTAQLVLDAIKHGCHTIYMGLGGSATNDGGMGFAAEIGVRFLDEEKNELEPIPLNMKKIASIDVSSVDQAIKDIKIIIMSDVKNPLLGPNGATYVYGKQKGATSADQVILEENMQHYIQIVEKTLKCDVATQEGAGAAGGFGAGLLAFTNATISSGVEAVLDILKFEDKLQGAQLVVTGEGRMDYQSAYGKVAYGVAHKAKKYGIPCVAIVGGMGERAEEMFEYGIDSIMTTVNGIMTIEDAIQNAPELCYSAAIRLFKFIQIKL